MIDRLRRVLGVLAALWWAGSVGAQVSTEAIIQQPGFIFSEFVAPKPPTPISHASTIVETRKGGLVVAWMGGSRERARDTVIWASRYEGKGWSEPVEIANGLHDAKHAQNAVWNPVLYKLRSGKLVLFYKEGGSPETWWGLYKTSIDDGANWSEPQKLPTAIYGPVRNKPIELPSGTLLCGSSIESSGWLVHMERTVDFVEWTRTEPINSSLAYGGVIQPTLIPWPDGKIQTLCRAKHGKIFGSWSDDAGYHWSRMKEIDLPNPNSAIDAVMLKNGKALLVYNHSQTDRSVLNVALSPDGKKWEAAFLLESEPGAEFCYPAVIQTADERVHITYTWKKQGIRHVVLDPAKLASQPIVQGQWPR